MRTPQRVIRMDDGTWAALGEAAATEGADRSTIIRRLVLGYLRDVTAQQRKGETGVSALAMAYFGRFEGPDHLIPTCPALRAVVPWRSPWPARTVDLVDPFGTDLCGWCTRVWHARERREAGR